MLYYQNKKSKGFTRKNFSKKNLGGFTLIELLIVIAIIGILASVVMSALNSARIKARNVARLSQFRQVQKALEMYYDDYGEYPDVTYGVFRGDCNGTVTGNDTNGIIPSLVPEYIPSISPDPTRNSFWWDSCTAYRSDGNDYAFAIFQFREPTSGYPRFDPNAFKGFIDPYRDGTADCTVDVSNPNTLDALKVYTEGACDW